jgi:hypothetical protein
MSWSIENAVSDAALARLAAAGGGVIGRRRRAR